LALLNCSRHKIHCSPDVSVHRSSSVAESSNLVLTVTEVVAVKTSAEKDTYENIK